MFLAHVFGDKSHLPIPLSLAPLGKPVWIKYQARFLSMTFPSCVMGPEDCIRFLKAAPPGFSPACDFLHSKARGRSCYSSVGDSRLVSILLFYLHLLETFRGIGPKFFD